MSIKIRYDGPDRKENDKRAISDSKDWLSSHFKEGWDMWEQILVLCGETNQVGTSDAFQSLNVQLSFVGIMGYPVHAIGRKYCPEAYRHWMTHDGYCELDSEGFQVEPVPQEPVPSP